MQTTVAYQEITDFIASGTNPESVLAFRPSSTLQNRVSLLLEKNKSNDLSQNEKSELDNFMILEHLMRLAKIRAYQMIHS